MRWSVRLRRRRCGFGSRRPRQKANRAARGGHREVKYSKRDFEFRRVDWFDLLGISDRGDETVFAFGRRDGYCLSILRNVRKPTARAGAAAISVLTERDFFRGSISDLEKAPKVARRPRCSGAGKRLRGRRIPDLSGLGGGCGHGSTGNRHLGSGAVLGSCMTWQRVSAWNRWLRFLMRRSSMWL